MGIKYKVMSVVGENKQTGKPIWRQFGIVVESTKGLRLKLEAVPIGTSPTDGGGVWFAFFEPDTEAQRAPAPQPKPMPTASDFDDDLPF